MQKNSNNNIRDFYILAALICLIFILSFRKFIFLDVYIGHTWDWGYPLYPSQIKKYAELIMFYVWNDTIDLGTPNYVSKSFFLFGFLNYILQFLGGIVLQRLVLLFIFIFSAYSLYRLAQFLSFNRYASFISSIFYAFSPLVYSRIVAGHVVYLVSYSFFPLFILVLLKYFFNADNNKKTYIYFGLLTIILSMHVSFIILAAIMVLFVVMLRFLLDRDIISVLRKIIYASLIALLLNAFWITAYITPFLSNNEIPRGWGLAANLGKISPDIEMAMRSNYLESASQPVSNIIRGIADNGLRTEFVFPMNDFVSHTAIAFSFFIPIMAFSTLLTVKRKGRNFWFFMILAVTGVTLSSGVRNPLGHIIYNYFLKYTSSLIYSAFSNPMRFMPLVYISYAALIGYFIESVFIGKQDGKYKIRPTRIHQIYKALPFLTVALFAYPFWSGEITKPLSLMFDQPLSLIATKPENEEKKVYEFLGKQKDIRVSYLPSAYNSFVGETDLNFEWSTSFSPVPEFMSGMNLKEPLSKYIQTLMVYDNHGIPVKHLGKLFGLAASKYIILPEYKDGILPYARFEGRTYIERDLKRSLMSQEDIVKDISAGELGKISIYKNQNVLPLIYGAASAKVFTGNLEDLRRYFETSEENNSEAYFFLSQMPDQQRKFLIKNVSAMDFEIIDTNRNLQFFLTPKEYLNPLFNYVVVDSGAGWAPLANNWSKDVNYAALLDKELGIYSERSSKSEKSSKPPRLSIEYRINKAGRYILYGLFYFHPAGGDIHIKVDGVGKFVAATRDSSMSYRYIPLGQADLEERLYKIDIIGESDAENVVLAIAIIPDNILSSTNAELREIINDYRYKLVLR